MQSFNFKPIGYFHCDLNYKFDAPRQGVENLSETLGRVVLEKGFNLGQGLKGLDGFQKIWLIYEFHKNKEWRPLTETPRSTEKQGVFATRAPYRPNPIGLSCVELVKIEHEILFVKGFDLLDQTPLLDIKPYIPTSDSFEVVNKSWIEDEDLKTVQISPIAYDQIYWLKENGVPNLEAFIVDQLKRDPINHKKKRVKSLNQDNFELCYRTWRINFKYSSDINTCVVNTIYSGYLELDLKSNEDTYQDKSIHKKFNNLFLK